MIYIKRTLFLPPARGLRLQSTPAHKSHEHTQKELLCSETSATQPRQRMYVSM